MQQRNCAVLMRAEVLAPVLRAVEGVPHGWGIHWC
jgi:hypothetical protein